MTGKKSSKTRQVKNFMTPEKIYAAQGSAKGEINLQWDAVNRARHYVVQAAHRTGQNWKHVDIISDPFYNLSGLGSGKTYLFRIAAVFDSGQGPWSEPVEKKVK
jgi:hypothetical protein